MIELKPNGPNTGGWDEDDLDELIASDAFVHLEQLSDDAIMLIVEDAEKHVHLSISREGDSPIRVWVMEQFTVTKEAPDAETGS